MTLKEIMNDVEVEVAFAMNKYKPFNSAHEGFAVLDEECDELWDEVKVKQGARDVERLYREAVQTAAMAVRFAHDCCKPGA